MQWKRRFGRRFPTRASLNAIVRISSAYLESFKIEPAERAEIENWDVAEIAARGVNPLLLLSFFSAVKSPRDLPEYLQKINTPPRSQA